MKERVRLRPRRVEDKRIRDEVSHDHDRYVTVLKSTWWTGAGEVYKPETMVPIREGGFMFHPAGYHQYDGAKDEDVIVQIIGMGPVQTVRAEVDEKGQPVPARR